MSLFDALALCGRLNFGGTKGALPSELDRVTVSELRELGLIKLRRAKGEQRFIPTVKGWDKLWNGEI